LSGVGHLCRLKSKAIYFTLEELQSVVFLCHWWFFFLEVMTNPDYSLRLISCAGPSVVLSYFQHYDMFRSFCFVHPHHLHQGSEFLPGVFVSCTGWFLFLMTALNSICKLLFMLKFLCTDSACFSCSFSNLSFMMLYILFCLRPECSLLT
jgi:hypothetical protein